MFKYTEGGGLCSFIHPHASLRYIWGFASVACQPDALDIGSTSMRHIVTTALLQAGMHIECANLLNRSDDDIINGL